MINGAHAMLFSENPEQDRKFLRDVLELPHVDVGGGWLIFGLPPAEIAVHPSDKNRTQELYLMCADIEAFVATMEAHSIVCAEVNDEGWGLVSQITLPGGGKLSVYEPRHARPATPGAAKPRAKVAARKKKPAPRARAPKTPARKAAKKQPRKAAKKARKR